MTNAEPPDNTLLWGVVHLTTPRYGEAFNVFLLEEPLPYGTWREAKIVGPPNGRALKSRGVRLMACLLSVSGQGGYGPDKGRRVTVPRSMERRHNS